MKRKEKKVSRETAIRIAANHNCVSREVAKIKGWQLPKHKHKQIKMGGQKKNAS